jgi:predicted methyltransferase
MNLRLLLLAALSVVAFTGCRTSQPAPAEASVKPGVNAEFLKPDLQITEWVKRFETESREIYSQRMDIVRVVGLKPGQSVADIGAGTGLFTPLFANAVGASGTVYAVDIAPEFVKHIRERAAESGLKQVRAVLGTDHSVELPANSVDVAFICDTYHHFEFPHSVMTSLHRALKPNGEVVVVDFKRIPGESTEWTLNHVRAGQEVFEKEITAAGFKKIGQSDILKQNYIVRFRKVGN